MTFARNAKSQIGKMKAELALVGLMIFLGTAAV